MAREHILFMQMDTHHIEVHICIQHETKYKQGSHNML